MPKLRVQIPGTARPREYELESDDMTIGKNPEKNTIVISDNRVSREHARIYQVGEDYLLEDRGSKNGTFVDGNPVAPNRSVRLFPGAVISLADACTITFLVPEEPSTESVVFSDRPMGEAVAVLAPGEVAVVEHALSPKEMATAPPQSLVDEVVKLQAQLDKQAQRLKLLYELGKSLSSVFSLHEIFRLATDVLFTLTPADRACVLLRDEKGDALVPAMVRERDDSRVVSGQMLLISETIVRRVVAEKVSIASFYAQADEQLKDVVSIFTKGIQSVMCAPLLGRGGALGVIYCDRRNSVETFKTEDLELLNAIAGEASTAVDNALSYEKLSREALARAAYGRFVPKHVVDQILHSPESLKPGGANLAASILFADIRGFTPLAEHQRPEAVVQLLNAYFQAMTEIIFEYGGTLDKFIGDGLMALFGVPYTGGNDAENAVMAAIAMQQRLPRLLEELRDIGFPPFGIGIGVNTGEITAGYIGALQRLDYTAIGDAVNLAARLEQTAEPGQIRVSEGTRAALGKRFRLEPLGELLVKGKSRPVGVFQVDWKAGCA